jgi:hypothetical protein
MTNLKVDNSKRLISPYLQFINSKGSGLFWALIHLADLLRERQVDRYASLCFTFNDRRSASFLRKKVIAQLTPPDHF